EQIVRFRYKFQYDESAIRDEQVPRYQAFNDSRDGQCVLVGIDLPKSLTDKLQEQMAIDPSSVRALVERLVLSNNNGNITEDYWKNGRADGSGGRIKPPYEELPDGWTIAVVIGREAKKYDRLTAVDYKV